MISSPPAAMPKKILKQSVLDNLSVSFTARVQGVNRQLSHIERTGELCSASYAGRQSTVTLMSLEQEVFSAR